MKSFVVVFVWSTTWLFLLSLEQVHGFVTSPPCVSTIQHQQQRSFSLSTKRTVLEIIPSRNRLKDLEWKKPDDDQVTEWLKRYGEVSRYYRRDVFDAGDWVRSRRPTRFWDTVKSTFQSGLVRQISLQIVALAVWSMVIVMYNSMAKKMTNTLFLPVLKMDLVPFNMAAASLGLLLTFRTNASYQRWNEARTAWGKIINDSRSLVRMACVWVRLGHNNNNNNNEKATMLLQRLADAVASFSRTIMNRTLPWQEDEANFRQYCKQYLDGGPNGDYAYRLVRAKHRPTAALAEVSTILLQLQQEELLHNTNPLYHIEMEKLVTELCSAMGACERILTSPVPTFYSRHTTRFLAFWLFLLPLALYQPLGGGWLLVPVMTTLGGFMVGIEELANQMEEPFSILPMEKMCQNSIRATLLQQVERVLGTTNGSNNSINNSSINGSGSSETSTLPQPPQPLLMKEEPVLPSVNGSNDEFIAGRVNGSSERGSTQEAVAEAPNGEHDDDINKNMDDDDNDDDSHQPLSPTLLYTGSGSSAVWMEACDI